jgi:phosphate transport system protein
MTLQREHTVHRFDDELSELRKRVVAMAGRAIEQVERAMDSLSARDEKSALRVTEDDATLDQAELSIDELSFFILARRQPVACDLRRVIMTLKIVTDLERIGDLAVNIAKRGRDLSCLPPSPTTIEHIGRLNGAVQASLRAALDALVNSDPDKARAVIRHDREIDLLNTAIIADIIALGAKTPDDVARSLALTSVSRHLERIGDHCKNIAEMIIYLVRGRDVRHNAFYGEQD